MIIELVGLPGSGKTTYAQTLVREKGYVIVNCKNRLEVLFYLTVGLVTYPRFLIKSFLWCFRCNSSLYYTWNFFALRYAKFIKATCVRGYDVVLDEGPLQNLLSYAQSTHSSKELLLFDRYVSLLDQVVVFAVDEITRHANIDRRDKGQTFKRKQANADREKYMLCNQNLLLEWCSSQPSCTVVRDVSLK